MNDDCLFFLIHTSISHYIVYTSLLRLSYLYFHGKVSKSIEDLECVKYAKYLQQFEIAVLRCSDRDKNIYRYFKSSFAHKMDYRLNNDGLGIVFVRLI
jgi:hypothetical protein